MKSLVTGGGGFVGRRWLSVCWRGEWRCLLSGVPPTWVGGNGSKFIQGDLGDKATTARLQRDGRRLSCRSES